MMEIDEDLTCLSFNEESMYAKFKELSLESRELFYISLLPPSTSPYPIMWIIKKKSSITLVLLSNIGHGR